MTEQAPKIDLSGGGGKLVYDKARRTIVLLPKEVSATFERWRVHEEYPCKIINSQGLMVAVAQHREDALLIVEAVNAARAALKAEC
jgi:hypothetical protein